MADRPEPWLRGATPGVDPVVAPLFFSFQQAREDLARFLEGMTPEQIWASPHGFGSAGFHVKHIAGSVGRLITYLQGGQLNAAQLAELQREKLSEGMGRAELLSLLDRALSDAETTLRSLDTSRLAEARAVGRMGLPTTVMGLLVHIAEHTQRHVGQAISAAKWARADF